MVGTTWRRPCGTPPASSSCRNEVLFGNDRHSLLIHYHRISHVSRQPLHAEEGVALTRQTSGTPPSDFGVDMDLVRRLLVSQHPDLCELSLSPLDAGWDNAMFRLGTRWAVRLPRRAAAARLITSEQRWLPSLASALPIAIPAPVRIGLPGNGYPWNWSIVPWIPGATADVEPPAEDQAERLAHFLNVLHVEAPGDAPTSHVRGVPLARRAAVVQERLHRLESRTSLVTPAVWRAWNSALEAPWEGESTWLHGDLHAKNVLVDQGSISGIIDWGDLAAGDKATDLAAIWMVLPSAKSRDDAMAAYLDTSESLWARARGWAVAFGALLLETGLVDHPRHARMGGLTLDRISSA